MSTVTLEEIAAGCAREFGVALDDMRRSHRNSGHREVMAVTARNVGMWLARLHSGLPSTEVYAFFGLAHVNYAGECVRKVTERQWTDAAFAERVARIELGLAGLGESEGRAAA